MEIFFYSVCFYPADKIYKATLNIEVITRKYINSYSYMGHAAWEGLATFTFGTLCIFWF